MLARPGQAMRSRTGVDQRAVRRAVVWVCTGVSAAAPDAHYGRVRYHTNGDSTGKARAPGFPRAFALRGRVLASRHHPLSGCLLLPVWLDRGPGLYMVLRVGEMACNRGAQA